MAVHRAALLWASLTLAVIMHGMVKGQQGPSIPMDYCATVNTGSVGPCESGNSRRFAALDALLTASA